MFENSTIKSDRFEGRGYYVGIWLGFVIALIFFILLLLLSVLQSTEFYRRETQYGFSTFFRATSSHQSRRNTLIWGVGTISVMVLFLIAVLFSTFTNIDGDKKSATVETTSSSSLQSTSSTIKINFNLDDIHVPEEINADVSGIAKVSGTAPIDMVQLVISNSEDNYVKRVMIEENGDFSFDYPIIFSSDSSREVTLYLCPTPVLNDLDKEDQKKIKVLPFV